MFISGENHCSNISRDIIDSAFYCLLFSGTIYDVTFIITLHNTKTSVSLKRKKKINNIIIINNKKGLLAFHVKNGSSMLS